MNKLISTLFVILFFLLNSKTEAQNCWSILDSAVSGGLFHRPNYAFAFGNYQGNLITAGQFGSSNMITVWNGSTWAPLGNTVSAGISGYVSAFAVYNGELYAAGQFDTIGGIAAQNIARWNGTSWLGIGQGIKERSYSLINSLAVYGDALYAGGVFDSIDGIATLHIAKWNGTSWSDVAGGTSGVRNPVGFGASKICCLFVFNNMLYVSGVFDTAGNIPALNIAAWNDTSWSNLGDGVNALVGTGGGTDGIEAIAAYNGDIYVGGMNLDSSGNTPLNNIAKWDGTMWSDVAGGVNNDIYTMFVYNGNLIVGGNFGYAGSDTAWNLAQWNGQTWSQFGDGVYGDISVGVLDTLKGGLYVGGNFTKIGNLVVNGIAEYNCATGITEIPSTNSIEIYPNPTAGILNISIDNLQDKAIVQIYNLLGQRVLQSNLNPNETELNLTGVSAGSYLYRITGANGEYIGSGNFVVQ